uniref:Uncharacterized protein n=1 Tax=Anguilla anguilla TaxID=7936 RepID=A0A0E9VWT1_ANGAN
MNQKKVGFAHFEETNKTCFFLTFNPGLSWTHCRSSLY